MVILGGVTGKAVEALARECMDNFKALDPAEYARWSEMMKFRREQMIDPKGFTKERELMLSCSIPMWVEFTLARLLGDSMWSRDAENMKAFRRACPECFINLTGSVDCAGDHH